MKSVLSRHPRERPVTHCWNMLVKDQWVGGSIRQEHRDAAQARTSVQPGGSSGGWHGKGPGEKSAPCIKNRLWGTQKQLKQSSQRRQGREKGNWQGHACRVRWERVLGLAEPGAIVMSQRGGGRREWISSSFTFAGLCPVLGSMGSGVLAKERSWWWCPFHGPPLLPSPMLNCLKPLKSQKNLVLFSHIVYFVRGVFQMEILLLHEGIKPCIVATEISIPVYAHSHPITVICIHINRSYGKAWLKIKPIVSCLEGFSRGEPYK